jgi:endonuclease YncB( thermonuclease family)
VPRLGSEVGTEAAKLIQSYALDKVTDVLVVGQSTYGTLQVVLFPSKTETDWSKSVNAQLVQKGLAAIAEDEDYPEQVDSWFKFQETARDDQVGFWQYGGIDDLDDE